MTATDSGISENELWLLSFYRQSEINGALFFGRVARTLRPGALQADVTQHFSDEAAHASYWTACIRDLGHDALKLGGAYQDHYLDAAGVPANLLDVLAVTQAFEKRVIGQYHRHLRHGGTHPRVRQTLEQIMHDERWHIRYVRRAIEQMTERFGADAVSAALGRFAAADREVYARHLAEHGERMAFLLPDGSDRHDTHNPEGPT